MENDSELRQLKSQQLKSQDTANNFINNSKVIPVNQKVKDSLFKTIYQKEERLTSLAQFLLKLDIKDIDISTNDRHYELQSILFNNYRLYFLKNFLMLIISGITMTIHAMGSATIIPIYPIAGASRTAASTFTISSMELEIRGVMLSPNPCMPCLNRHITAGI